MSHVQAPVDPIEVKVIVTRLGIGLTDGSLDITTKNLAKKGILVATTKCPRVILRGSQVNLIKLINPV